LVFADFPLKVKTFKVCVSTVFGVNKMKRYRISTSSVTYAIKTKDLLRRNGFKATVERSNLDYGKKIVQFIVLVFYCGFVLDLSFFAFNLLPVYPLDGFRLVDVFAKKRGKLYNFLLKNGNKCLLALMLLSVIANAVPALYFLDVFGYFMSFAVDILGYPITAFWNFIFK